MRRPVRRMVMEVMVLLCAVAVVAARPWSSYTEYYCPYCLAHVTRHWVYFVQLPAPTSEGKLYRYWMREVDPRHKHVFWTRRSVNTNPWRECSELITIAELSPAREDRAIEMLKRLPTPAARKAAVEECLQTQADDWDGLISPRPALPARH